MRRQCPIDENECLFKTSNLTVETEVIYRYIFWTNSSFSNTFKCVLEQNASSFMDALTRLWKQCSSEIVVYPLSYVFTVILVFLVFLHHILVWLKCNIILVYVKRSLWQICISVNLQFFGLQRNRNNIYDLDIFFQFSCKTIFAKCISKTDEACNNTRRRDMHPIRLWYVAKSLTSIYIQISFYITCIPKCIKLAFLIIAYVWYTVNIKEKPWFGLPKTYQRSTNLLIIC